MLRTTLFAATLLLAPVAAFASGGHHGGGYVIDAEPSIAVSIGAPYSGFNLYYQSGGHAYVPVAPVYYRAPVVVRAPYYPAHRVHYSPSRHDWHDGGRHHRNDDRHHGRHRDGRHDRDRGHGRDD